VRISSVFHPKLHTALQGYRAKDLLRDATAGVIVGLVALPLAIAFAISSGVGPEKGLTTAIVAGFLISALGGSRVQIGGPTGAFVVIVYGIVEKYGLDGLLVCTFLAGLMLIAMGALRLGAVIRFLPYPLTVGFTSGIAVIIFSQQVKDLLGLKAGAPPADFIDKWAFFARHISTADAATVRVSAATLFFLIVWPKISRKIPGPIVAIVLVTAAVKLLRLPVETIGTRFGEIRSALPAPSWPGVTFANARALLSPAFTVAMLGAIESLLSATVADGMIDGRHRSNTELIAQGLANVASSFFGGIPATGAIARTATNVKNGGRTPVAGIIHALTLLLIALAFGKWAALIPMAALAAILVIVSWHMSELHAFIALLRAPKSDMAVLLTTFLLTVLVDLTVAVEIGMLLALVLFMKRMTDVTSVREATAEWNRPDDEGPEPRRPRLPPGVCVFEAEGAFFFGAAESLRDTFSLGATAPQVLIIRMRRVLALDATGIRALEDLRRRCEKSDTRLMLCGLQPQPLRALEGSGAADELGRPNLVPTFEEAVERASRYVESPS
jgi:SulP family sulfate permease